VKADKRSLLVDLAILLALALIAVIGYKYSPLLLPKADLTLTPETGCDLNQRACRADVPGGGGVELSLMPHPVPVVRPMQVAATASVPNVRKVEVDFAGISMNMGYNRVALDAAGDHRYAGTATIPVCITGRMGWRATLMVETDSQRIAVPFVFDAPLGAEEHR
jgi:hypothetical protein